MMKRKLILTGAALSLAVAMTGCGGNPVINQQPSSQAQEQAQLISMEAAQEAALKAANIAAENAAISATTLNEVAGTSCYKVEFTSGDYAYAYTVNAETGAIMEMSSRDKIAVDTQALTEATTPAATSDTTPAQNTATAPSQTVTGTVNEETAQKIALEHAGVKATDATITKSKLDYEGGRQVYEIEWYAGGKKYDYEIAVDTGEILSSGYDEKTSGWSGSNSVTVSEADAKQTALGRVSGATQKDIYEWQFDYDDGRPEYEGKIIYGGTEYDFTIDASNGSVVEWEAESVR